MQSMLHDRSSEKFKDQEHVFPDFFADLNLDQVINAITKPKQDYSLKPIFFTLLHDVESVEYRQKIFMDLENPQLLATIKLFADEMAIVRRNLNQANSSYYRFHREGWFLEAVNVYCGALETLGKELSSAKLGSDALKAFIKDLTDYLNTSQFVELSSTASKIEKDLSEINYSIVIKNLTVRVGKYEQEIDYSTEVERTFEKFKQKEVHNYRTELIETSGMNHVTAQILRGVSKLFPEIFLELTSFYQTHNNFINEGIQNFDREIQFFVAYLDFISKFKSQKLAFCYPTVSTSDKHILAEDSFDIALANKCYYESTAVVTNDFSLVNNERVIVISGPNQGGKTTFARMFGQLHYLASLGCPVPGRTASLFLFDQILTHFEAEEDIRNLRGKLKDDLVRIHDILEHATPNSIIIMNEIFTSTTLQDAVFLSKKIFEKILELDALGVCVSFIDELSTLSEKTVSMVSTIVPENPAQRTFKIIRKRADGLSYAISIAEKHHLTYSKITERIAQ